jgi:protein-disulfide isomerase
MFYVVLGVIAVAGVLAILYAVRGGGGGATATEPVALDVADARELMERAEPKRVGQEDAPVRIIVFSDYQCPGCGVFALQQRARFMPWIERGDAQLLLYDYPLGGSFVHGFLASRAARCAAEQPMDGTHDGTAFLPYHDMLYQQRNDWAQQRTAVDTFIGYAGMLGLNTREFEQCLRSDRHAEVVTANRMLGDQLGVRGTPTVLVNNRRIGGRTIDEMGDQVVEMLESLAGREAVAP